MLLGSTTLATTPIIARYYLADATRVRALYLSSNQPNSAAESLTKGSIAFGLAYTTISAVWYGIGLFLVLSSPVSKNNAANVTPLTRAIRRVGQAWLLTFAASQVTTPWRVAGAAAMSPLVDITLRKLNDFFGNRSRLLPPIIYATSVMVFFCLAIAALVARELVK